MTHEDLIRGSEAILDFLLEVPDSTLETFETHMLNKMTKVLSEFVDAKSGFIDMIEFTLLANKEYQIMPEPLWKESAKEFFSTDKSIRFFTSILRDKKIDQIISEKNI